MGRKNSRLGRSVTDLDTPSRSSLDGLGFEPTRALNFPVVGMGTSAEGLQALEALIKRLQAQNMAFIVVQPWSTQNENPVTRLLSRYSRLPVVAPKDGVEVQRDHIYLAPPESFVSLDGGRLRLDRPDGIQPRLPIDFFFRSLAKEQGAGAIGVILSGTGTDGRFGVKEIKGAGGITFVQGSASAQDGPIAWNPIDSGYADFVLTPEQIADELVRVSRHPYITRIRPDAEPAPDTFSRIVALLGRGFTIDFEQYHPAAIERRIERRMALNRIDRIDEYLRMLQSTAHERSTLRKDVLGNVTSYFHEPEPFEALSTSVFPAILKAKRGSGPIRVWVVGCSTGEEAYSIAICLMEALSAKADGHTVQIFATDVDPEAIAFARAGLYPRNIELNVSSERLERFFFERDDHYHVSRRLREAVVFAAHDVANEPAFSRVDLISCRNVLLNLQSAVQQKVLRTFHHALNPKGYLLVGGSENVGDASGLFKLVDRSAKLYRKKPHLAFTAIDSDVDTAPQIGRTPVTIEQLADREVLERFAPAGVLIDENMEVLQFRGKVGPFIDPAPGGASLNILKLIRPELVVPLRNTIAAVQQQGEPSSSGAIRLLSEDPRELSIHVLPVPDPDSRANCLVVLFETAQPRPAAGPKESLGQDGGAKAETLTRELIATREYLQSVIEELNATNADLQSSNEELQASAEESQSTNEELQTTNEELQSTNEELASVNEELHRRMLELARFKDDLTNIMKAVDVPILLLGVDQRLRGITNSAERILGISVDDIGRPIGDLLPKPEGAAIAGLVDEAINRVREGKRSLKGGNGRSYQVRVLPYQTADHQIKGAIVTLGPQEPSASA